MPKYLNIALLTQVLGQINAKLMIFFNAILSKLVSSICKRVQEHFQVNNYGVHLHSYFSHTC